MTSTSSHGNVFDARARRHVRTRKSTQDRGLPTPKPACVSGWSKPSRGGNRTPRRGALATAFTARNRCHTDTTGPPPDAETARNSLHRQEPMPPAVRRATARCGFSSQQPSPPGTDATWLSPSSASSCSILATAFTARNRCHLLAATHGYPKQPDSQHPSPPGTDATVQPCGCRRLDGALATPFTTKNRCHRKGGPVPLTRMPRNTLHRQEPMPLAGDVVVGLAVAACNTLHRQEPMPRMPRIGCTSQVSSRNSLHHQGPMPQADRGLLAQITDSHDSLHRQEPMPHTDPR